MERQPHHITDKRLLQYLETCLRMYQRMKRDNTWPWRDSTLSKDLVESDDSQNRL